MTHLSKRWCFTLQNPAIWDISLLSFSGGIVYGIWQLEAGINDYVQGYVEFSSPTTLCFVRKLIRSAHWEFARGTNAQHRAYCMNNERCVKGTRYFEIGIGIAEVSSKALKFIIEEIRTKALLGVSTEELHKQYSCVYYQQSIDYYISFVHESLEYARSKPDVKN